MTKKYVYQTYYLYKIECDVPDVGAYIGFTTRPEAREYEHRRGSSGAKLRAAMKLYGQERFTFNVIDECDSEEKARALEIEYMHSHGTVWPKGLNVVGGGKGIYSTESYENVKSHKTKGLIERWSNNENRRKQSETLKHVMNSPAVKKASSEAAKLRWANPEYRAAQKAAREGVDRSHSEETKKKLSEIRKRIFREKFGEPKGVSRKFGSVANGDFTWSDIARMKITPESTAKRVASWQANRDANLEKIRASNAKHNSDPEIIAKRLEGRKKFYETNKRKPVSDETRAKMSESQTSRYRKISDKIEDAEIS